MSKNVFSLIIYIITGDQITKTEFFTSQRISRIKDQQNSVIKTPKTVSLIRWLGILRKM